MSYINPHFLNIPTMVQNFETLLENFDLVNMSKLVISKPNIRKTDISYLKFFENFEPPYGHWQEMS